MSRRLSTFGATAVVLGIGIVIGYGAGEAARPEQSRAADAAPAAPQAANAPVAAAQKADQPKHVKRVGQVIGLKPEMKEKYIELHANTWPGVLKRIEKSNIRNYSIYLAELEGKFYLFSYFEYVGDDWDADMKAIADDPITQKWWKETDPCQIRLPGTPEGSWWKPIPEVFHAD
jgi:L-rhamnose mutarotase